MKTRNLLDVRGALTAAREAAAWAKDPAIVVARKARGIDQPRLAREAARSLDMIARHLTEAEKDALTNEEVSEIQAILDANG